MKRKRFFGIRFARGGKGPAGAKGGADKKLIAQLRKEKNKLVSLGEFDKARIVDLQIKSLKMNGGAGRNGLGHLE